MLRSLGVNHRNEYEQVGKETGLSYGVLDSASLAASAEDARLKDWQMIRSLKYLCHGLGGKVAESFIDTKKFTKGYVESKVKKFEHQYNNGDIATIECMYQNVAEMTLN